MRTKQSCAVYGQLMVWIHQENHSVRFTCFSTIHGRIDQVNQLLELDYQKRGGARYTALDKWTNQLNSLNQAIVSKLTWWHVKTKRQGDDVFEHIDKIRFCASSRNPLRRDTPHRFENATNMKKTANLKNMFKVLFLSWWEEVTGTYFCFHVPDWQIRHVRHTNASNVQNVCITCTQYFNVYCCLLVINRFLSALKKPTCLWLVTGYESNLI